MRALVWLGWKALPKQQAASRGAPAKALAEFPPAWIERGRGGQFRLALARPWAIQPSSKRLPTQNAAAGCPRRFGTSPIARGDC